MQKSKYIIRRFVRTHTIKKWILYIASKTLPRSSQNPDLNLIKYLSENGKKIRNIYIQRIAEAKYF